MQLLIVQQNRRRVPLLACCAPALVLIAMLLAGCPARPNGAGQNDAGQTAEARVEYVGRITDAQTQRGIAGAKVALEFAGAPPIVYTDGEGVFRFTVPSTGPTLAGRVRVEAKGYAIYDRNVDIAPSAPRLEDIRLNPEIVLPVPTPTLTPIAADILIAQFDASQATRPVEIGRRLEQDLERQLRAYDLDDVVVKVLDQPVDDDEQATALAQSTGSRAVIWGWYDNYGISVHILLADLGSQSRDVPGINDLPLVLGGDPAADIAFTIRQVLPENVSFLSLFVIGHLYTANNEYANARTAFDAATANLPENVAFENQAILHFFRARQMEAAGSEEYDAIICEYAAAIAQDPTLAEAYNNLGVLVARAGIGAVRPLSDDARQCVEQVGIELGNLLGEALALRPDWVVPKYNLLAQQWASNPDAMNDAEVRAAMEGFLQQDPTLSGAYIVLGLIEAEAGNYAEADERLMGALEHVPKNQAGPVYAALGQISLRQEAYADAEQQYRLAMTLDPHDSSLHEYLATAVLMQSRALFLDGQLEEAAQGLDALLQDERVTLTLHSAAFLRYLAGLLAAAAGDAARAEAHLAAPELVSAVAEASATPIGVASGLPAFSATAAGWPALAERCASAWQGSDESILEDVLVNDPCLPVDLHERISALYDLWQGPPERRFYPLPSILMGQACPFVFTYEHNIGEWLFDTTILYNIVGPEGEQVQARPLARFDGRLLIREVEPEQSWIDLLAVIGVGADGTVTTWLPQAAALRRADDVYLHLEQGDEVVVSFVPADPELADALLAAPLPAAASPAGAAHWWVVAEGYYVPYAVAEPEADATGSHREGGKP